MSLERRGGCPVQKQYPDPNTGVCACLATETVGYPRFVAACITVPRCISGTYFPDGLEGKSIYQWKNSCKDCPPGTTNQYGRNIGVSSCFPCNTLVGASNCEPKCPILGQVLNSISHKCSCSAGHVLGTYNGVAACITVNQKVMNSEVVPVNVTGNRTEGPGPRPVGPVIINSNSGTKHTSLTLMGFGLTALILSLL